MKKRVETGPFDVHDRHARSPPPSVPDRDSLSPSSCCNLSDNDNSSDVNDNNNSKGLIGTTVIVSAMVGTLGLISPFVTTQFQSALPYMATPKHKVIKALRFIVQHQHRNREQQLSVKRRPSAFTAAAAANGRGGRRGSKEVTKTSNMREIEKAHRKPTVTGADNTRNVRDDNNNNDDDAPLRIMKFYDLGSGDGTAVLAAASFLSSPASSDRSRRWRAVGLELNFTLYLVSSLRRHLSFFSFSSPSSSLSHAKRQCSFRWANFFRHPLRDATVVYVFGARSVMPQLCEKINRECRLGTYIVSYRFRLPSSSLQSLQYRRQQDDDDDDGKEGKEVLSTVIGKQRGGGGRGDSLAEEREGRRKTTGLAKNAELIYDEEEMRVYILRDR